MLKWIMQVVVGMMSVCALAACNSTEPGTGDVKTALQVAWGNCSAIEVSDLTLENGYAGPTQDTYYAKVSYTVTLHPVRPVKNEIESYDQSLVKYMVQVNQAKANYDKYVEAQNTWLAQNPGRTISEFRMSDASAFNQSVSDSVEAESADSALRASRWNEIVAFKKMVGEACPNTEEPVLNVFFNRLPDSLDVYDRDMPFTTETTLLLHQTRRGWRIAE